MGAIGHKDNSGNLHFYNGVSVPNGLKIDLLWENPNPTIDFASQDISLTNLNNYDYLIFLIEQSTNDNLTHTQLIKINTSTNNKQDIFAISEGSYLRISRRQINFGENKITVGNGYDGDKFNGNASSNSLCIPLSIYGIK